MASPRPSLGNAKKRAPAPIASEAGIELEAALQRTAPLIPTMQPVHAVPLDEPEGEFVPGPAAAEAAPATTAGPYLESLGADEVQAIDASFARLLAEVHANRPGDDLEIIRKAWLFCLKHHAGQRRASGDPYVVHPLEVAHVIAELKMDSTAVAAGLLHDAVEDTDVTNSEIAAQFGDQVAYIVEGVTKLDKIKFANREDHQAENIRKMLLAMVTDIRVVIIKLADRLHNMRTLEHLREEKREKIARETLDIYAPLAHRLGMGKLRGELEDLAFRYTESYEYEQLSGVVDSLRVKGEEFLQEIVGKLEGKLKEFKIPGRVESRIKRLYSIQQKLNAHQIPVDQVYDLFAFRVITDTVQNCYALLGLLHSIWRPVPGRIKDFIAMPRPNLYQSLHTTLIADGGHQFEVQIRTEEMHRVAEEGIAAHWKYKAGDAVSAKDEQRLAWVRQLVEWQREMSDPNEFMSTLKIDLYPEEVYTFTPKGKVVVLPKDASPIDFAYAIHTEVGNTTVGAKVNGRIVPLRAKLKNGDIVEITTQTGHAPSRDWLSFAKSSRARNKIKHWINEHQRERAIEVGRKLLEREARKFKVAYTKFGEADFARVASMYGLATGPEIVAGVGFGKYSARQVLNKLEPGATTNEQEETAPSAAVTKVSLNRASDSLQVAGQDDLLVYRARCCNPIRGEEIVGYVTRGKGVAVHALTCSNVQNLMYESDRRIQVEWADAVDEAGNKQVTYPVKLTIQCDDRSGLLKEFTAIISDDGTNIRSVETRPNDDGTVAVEFVIEALDVRHVVRLTQNLRRVPGVREVLRQQKV